MRTVNKNTVLAKPASDCIQLFAMLGVVAIGSIFCNTAAADSRDQAKRMHDRLTGVPPAADVLESMAADIRNNDAESAAYIAMEHPAFYNVTLKNWATPWTNRERTTFAPLNDYSATVIGMVRDNVPFNDLLSANLVYHANGASIPGKGTAPNFSPANNDHYEWLEENGADLSDESVLQADAQSNVLDIPASATAGIMTTRAAAAAFFVGGTNRAMFRFTLLNHMCNDLEQVKDITLPPDRVRQDVSRSPGGDSRIYLNNCVGCHSGMDPMAQAFAYYQFDEESGRMNYTQGTVQEKYFINGQTFNPGFITPDDGWDNYWRNGQNAALGWDNSLPGAGNGAKSMGRELASSRTFAACQVKKAFRLVCLRDPSDATDRSQVESMTDKFQTNYLMKPVFAEAAAYCKGE